MNSGHNYLITAVKIFSDVNVQMVGLVLHVMKVLQPVPQDATNVKKIQNVLL